MKRLKLILLTFILFIVVLFSLSEKKEKNIIYPKITKSDQTDEYFGTIVKDPYRCLEDMNSAETKAWIDAQNRVTLNFFSQIQFRIQIFSRIRHLKNYPRYGIPFKAGDNYFFYKNDGHQYQDVLYRQKDLNSEPDEVINPNIFTANRVSNISISKDGKYAVYCLSLKETDWQEFRVMDIESKKDLSDDIIKWIKFSNASWLGKGFYYSRYPLPEKNKELTEVNKNHQVYYHRLGTSQKMDEIVYENRLKPNSIINAETDEDEKYTFLYINDRSDGSNGNSILYRNDYKGEKKFKALTPDDCISSYEILTVTDSGFLVCTNKGANNYKIILIDQATPSESAWQTLIPENEYCINNVSIAGGKIFVTYLQNAATKVYVYDLKGNFENIINLPGSGTAAGFKGSKDSTFVFYSFSTFNMPASIYRYDIKTKKSSLFRSPETPFNPDDYELKQVFYASKDKTSIPMYIVNKKGIKMNGKNPVLLYAYGGFNISQIPYFNPALIAWLEQGGVFALANIRGGGEYGEKWHEDGTRLKKQNSIDDFISAAEYLIQKKYTSKKFLAARGISNGGLLIGAVINQRPDLFKAAIIGAGVLDMLRYHKFTIGSNLLAEYGSSESSIEDFKNLYSYSPLHNIKAQKYPAVLITTTDTDDRVVPFHSYKYTAALQEMNTSINPILIHIEQTHGGHYGSMNPGDIYSFIFYIMGITPEFSNY